VPYVAVLAGALTLMTPHGILAVAATMAGLMGLFAVGGWAVATHILGVSVGTVARTLAGPAAAALTMVVPLLLVLQIPAAPAITLLVALPVALAAYLTGIHLFAPDAAARLRGLTGGRRIVISIRRRERTAAGS